MQFHSIVQVAEPPEDGDEDGWRRLPSDLRRYGVHQYLDPDSQRSLSLADKLSLSESSARKLRDMVWSQRKVRWAGLVMDWVPRLALLLGALAVALKAASRCVGLYTWTSQVVHATLFAVLGLFFGWWATCLYSKAKDGTLDRLLREEDQRPRARWGETRTVVLELLGPHRACSALCLVSLGTLVPAYFAVPEHPIWWRTLYLALCIGTTLGVCAVARVLCDCRRCDDARIDQAAVVGSLLVAWAANLLEPELGEFAAAMLAFFSLPVAGLFGGAFVLGCAKKRWCLPGLLLGCAIVWLRFTYMLVVLGITPPACPGCWRGQLVVSSGEEIGPRAWAAHALWAPPSEVHAASLAAAAPLLVDCDGFVTNRDLLAGRWTAVVAPVGSWCDVDQFVRNFANETGPTGPAGILLLRTRDEPAPLNSSSVPVFWLEDELDSALEEYPMTLQPIGLRLWRRDAANATETQGGTAPTALCLVPYLLASLALLIAAVSPALLV